MTELTELRTCKECEIKKPLTDYYKCSKTAWRRKCKKCNQKRVQKWCKENKDLHNKHCNDWRNKNKEKYNNYINTYTKEHYDPVKKHIINMKYLYGKNELSKLNT